MSNKLLILGTKRSGTTFLQRKVVECHNLFDDINFTKASKADRTFIRQSDVVLFRFHDIWSTPDINLHWQFVNACVAEASKVIIHSRENIFDLTLSDRVAHETDFKVVRGADKPDLLKELTLDSENLRQAYLHNKKWIAMWEQYWLNIASNKCLRTYYSDLANSRDFVKRISEFAQLELSCSDAKWLVTDFKQIPNYDSLREAVLCK